MLLFSWLLVFLSSALAFPFHLSLPVFNSFPTYNLGDKVDLLVNTISSNIIDNPLSYYNVPFVCPPTQNVKPVHMSLPEILNGNNFMQSDYKLSFGNDEPCLRLCDRIMSKRNVLKSIDLIKNDYIAHWIIDGIPASTTFITDSSDTLNNNKKYYIPGFSLGFTNDNGDAFIHNHLMMVIRYHKEANDKFSIVGFEIYPKSVDDYHCPGASKKFKNLKLDPTAATQLVQFTYSIYWREDPDLDFKNRNKLYIDPSLIDSNGKFIANSKSSTSSRSSIHWVSLINSFVIISFVSLFLAFIFIVTFRSNINIDQPNSNFTLASINSFTSPSCLSLISILSGSGIQLLFTLLSSGLFHFFLYNNKNPFNNPNTSFYLIISIVIIGGFFAGFSSIQFYKLFIVNKQITIRRSIFISSLSSTFLISLVLITIIITNKIVLDKNSPRSLKFFTFLQLFTLYIVFQIPISLIGGLISRKFNIFTSLISKKLPSPKSSPTSTTTSTSTPLYLRFPLSILLIGILPCSVVFIESRFIYMALFNANSNYIYGFILLVAILLSIIMIEIGMILFYLLLNKGARSNWQWWIFINCTLSIWVYLLMISIYQLIYKLNLNAGNPVLYMVYSIILNSIISLSCGSLALWSSTGFVYTVILMSDVKKD